MDSIETKFCKKCSRDLPRTEEYYFRLYDHLNEKYKWDGYCGESFKWEPDGAVR